MDAAARIRVLADVRRRGYEAGARDAGVGYAERIRLLEQRMAEVERTISELIETLSADATRRLEAMDDGNRA